MPQGYDVYCRIWRMENNPVADDVVGGAIVTGSVAYETVRMRFEPQRANLLLLEQGLETTRLISIMLWPASLVIYERDELEVTRPAYHPNFGQRFRITTVNRMSIHPADPRGFIHIFCERMDRTRTVQ